jgi:hypothetical protein
MKITLSDCLKATSIDRAAIFVATKVAFDRNRGYTRSLNGENFWQFARQFDHTLDKIQRDILSESYVFSPYKERIRVRSGKERKIYISEWDDKIVERWLATALNCNLKSWLSDNSYAYRSGTLGVNRCQNKAIQAVRKCQFFVKRDITKFFYSIDHEFLFAQLYELLSPELIKLLQNRIKFAYGSTSSDIQTATIGLPFGSPLACVLANIHLTHIDRLMKIPNIHYFRYADDFLLASEDAQLLLDTSRVLDDEIQKLGLTFKPSHTENIAFDQADGFEFVKRFKFLGLEFLSSKTVKLPIEKQRKIINLFKRSLYANRYKIMHAEDRVIAAIEAANQVISKRIRSVAIVDYYLKHTTDEHQLRNMDRIITELVISAALNKPFRKKDFRRVPYKRLRKLGLVSLLHRHRLHKHGHLNIPFLSIYDNLLLERMDTLFKRNRERINRIKLTRKLKKQEKT